LNALQKDVVVWRNEMVDRVEAVSNRVVVEEAVVDTRVVGTVAVEGVAVVGTVAEEIALATIVARLLASNKMVVVVTVPNPEGMGVEVETAVEDKVAEVAITTTVEEGDTRKVVEEEAEDTNKAEVVEEDTNKVVEVVVDFNSTQ
jgi:hypothetical protein